MKKRTIEVSEETYQKIKDQISEDEVIEINSYEDLVGQKLFIRTVNYHHIGKVEKQVGEFLFMKDTVWVADSGRFMNAIKDGELKEVEPVGNWYVSINAITDFGIWEHEIPKKQK